MAYLYIQGNTSNSWVLSFKWQKDFIVSDFFNVDYNNNYYIKITTTDIDKICHLSVPTVTETGIDATTKAGFLIDTSTLTSRMYVFSDLSIPELEIKYPYSTLRTVCKECVTKWMDVKNVVNEKIKISDLMAKIDMSSSFINFNQDELMKNLHFSTENIDEDDIKKISDLIKESTDIFTEFNKRIQKIKDKYSS